MLAMVFVIIAVQLYTIGSSESRKELLLLAPTTAIATAPATVAISFFNGWHVTVTNDQDYLIWATGLAVAHHSPITGYQPYEHGFVGLYRPPRS